MAISSHSRLDLVSSPSAPRQARVHARNLLVTWRVPEAVADSAVLVVSELVTNAVVHVGQARDGFSGCGALRCSLTLWLSGGHLSVAVHDQDPRPPVVRQAEIGAERGRGLALVDALAEAWGYTYPRSSNGKLVWARLPLALAETGPPPTPKGRRPANAVRQ